MKRALKSRRYLFVSLSFLFRLLLLSRYNLYSVPAAITICKMIESASLNEALETISIPVVPIAPTIKGCALFIMSTKIRELQTN